MMCMLVSTLKINVGVFAFFGYKTNLFHFFCFRWNKKGIVLWRYWSTNWLLHLHCGWRWDCCKFFNGVYKVVRSVQYDVWNVADVDFILGHLVCFTFGLVLLCFVLLPWFRTFCFVWRHVLRHFVSVRNFELYIFVPVFMW